MATLFLDRGAPITIRLVKGAYWDYETVLADQNGWAPPVWRTKAETDACYERISRRPIALGCRSILHGLEDLGNGRHGRQGIGWRCAAA